MKAFSLVTGLVLATGLGSSAMAGQILASDPQTLMNYFFDKGVPAQLTADNVGDPLIEFRYEGDEHSVFFYDCTDNKNCLSLQFYSGYRTETSVGVDVVNQWNTDRRFVRAYLTDEGSSRIEMDIATGDDGVSDRDFSQLFDLWVESVAMFEDRIGW